MLIGDVLLPTPDPDRPTTVVAENFRAVATVVYAMLRTFRPELPPPGGRRDPHHRRRSSAAGDDHAAPGTTAEPPPEPLGPAEALAAQLLDEGEHFAPAKAELDEFVAAQAPLLHAWVRRLVRRIVEAEEARVETLAEHLEDDEEGDAAAGDEEGAAGREPGSETVAEPPGTMAEPGPPKPKLLTLKGLGKMVSFSPGVKHTSLHRLARRPSKQSDHADEAGTGGAIESGSTSARAAADTDRGASARAESGA